MDGNQMLLSIFKHWDGYPAGLGRTLQELFGKCEIINGIADQKAPAFANGIGCFAAQLVKALKNEIGDIHIRDVSIASQGEEFSYTLSEKDGTLHLHVGSGSMTMFGCPGDEEKDMITLYAGSLADYNPGEEE